MKKFLLLPLLLMLLLVPFVVGELAYVSTIAPSTAIVPKDVAIINTSLISVWGTDGCWKNYNSSYGSESIVLCSTPTAVTNWEHVTGSTSGELLYRFGNFNDRMYTNRISVASIAQGVLYFIDFLPSTYFYGANSTAMISVQNGNELLSIDRDSILYFSTINSGFAYTNQDASYFYKTTFSDNLDYTNITLLNYYDDKIYTFFTVNDTINVYDITGGYIDTLYIPGAIVSNPTSFWFDSNNGYMAIYDASDDDIHFFTYATGGGSNETFLLGGQEYDYSLCIDENYLCSNTSYVLSGTDIIFYCPDVSYLTYCSSGCENVETDNVISGDCSQLACSTQSTTCNVEGATYCTSPTTYTTCGQYDADACLEYGSVSNCPAGYFCADTPLGSDCFLPSYEDGVETYTQSFMWVNTELSSVTGVIKTQGTSPKTKNLLSSAVSGFINGVTGGLSGLFPSLKSSLTTNVVNSITTAQVNETYSTVAFLENNSYSIYRAFDCDYNEQFLIQDTVQYSNLPQNGWVGTGTVNTSGQYNFIDTSSLNKTLNQKDNMVVNTIFELQDTGIYELTYYDDTDALASVEFDYNKTSFELFGRESLGNKSLFNSTSLSDDLQEIVVENKFVSDSNVMTIEITIIRLVLGEYVQEKYYSLPITVSVNPDRLAYTTTDSFKIYSVIQSVVPNGYPTYSQTTDSTSTETCTHENTECYIVRSYANSQGMSTYYFFDEEQTCINSLNGLTNITISNKDIVSGSGKSVIENILNADWTPRQALFYSVLLLMLCFGIFGGAYLIEHDRTFLFVGVLLTGILLVYFVLEGFIPVWAVILFGIIGAMISANAIKNMSVGR